MPDQYEPFGLFPICKEVSADGGQTQCPIEDRYAQVDVKQPAVVQGERLAEAMIHLVAFGNSVAPHSVTRQRFSRCDFKM